MESKLPQPPPNLTRPSEVRALLARLDFHPSRVLGQNFLIDRNILNILLGAAAVEESDRVVEVGPGLGVLTGALLERGARVTAVEKDLRLAAWIRERFAGAEALELVVSDVLDCDFAALFPEDGMKLVANLPYAVAARLLVETAAVAHPPERIVVTVQREVAGRIAAAPSTSDYGLLSILLQRPYEVETVKHISPACFWPPPTVQSSIVRLTRRAAPLGGEAPEAELRGLLRHVFAQRRKTLARSLRDWAGRCAEPSVALVAVGLSASARPEEVPPEVWPALWRSLTAGETGA